MKLTTRKIHVLLRLHVYFIPFCFLLLFFQIRSGYCQLNKTYQPFFIEDTIPDKVYHALKARLQADKMSITAKGKVGNYMKTLYDQRFDYVVKNFNNDFFITNSPLNGRINAVLDHIYTVNPQLKRETSLYIFRSETPNAMSFGDGTLAIMLGMLSRVETEDVLAFVICHELAHHHLNHTGERIERIAELNYDRVLKKQIDAINNSAYERYTKMTELFKSLDMSFNTHSRDKEAEADSVGLTYFLKTKYARHAPLRTMQILDKADKHIFQQNIDFRARFSFKEFPFKDHWDQYKKSTVWHKDNSDSLTTHPNCEQRLTRMQRQLGISSIDSVTLRKGISWQVESDVALLEIINSQYHAKQYGRALFNSLLAADKFPGNAYVHAMIVKSLFQIYKAQQEHRLSKVLELPDPRFDENYDRFLSFIHKLRVSEIAGLAYNYAVNQPDTFFKDEEFIHALWMVSRLNFSQLDPGKVKEDYLSMFPKGRYATEMKKY